MLKDIANDGNGRNVNLKKVNYFGINNFTTPLSRYTIFYYWKDACTQMRLGWEKKVAHLSKINYLLNDIAYNEATRFEQLATQKRWRRCAFPNRVLFNSW